MQAILPFLIGGLALAVVAVLLVGVINMARRDHSPRTSNKLMRWRVGLQFGAVMALLALLLLGRG